MRVRFQKTVRVKSSDSCYLIVNVEYRPYFIGRHKEAKVVTPEYNSYSAFFITHRGLVSTSKIFGKRLRRAINAIRQQEIDEWDNQKYKEHMSHLAEAVYEQRT